MPLEAIISGPVISILSPDNYNNKYTAIAQGEPTEELTNPALGPDTGTLELGDKQPAQIKTYTPVEFGPLDIDGYYPLYNHN